MVSGEGWFETQQFSTDNIFARCDQETITDSSFNNVAEPEHLPRHARDKRILNFEAEGRPDPIFEPFIYKNEHFTKTGSGQT